MLCKMLKLSVLQRVYEFNLRENRPFSTNSVENLIACSSIKSAWVFASETTGVEVMKHVLFSSTEIPI